LVKTSPESAVEGFELDAGTTIFTDCGGFFALKAGAAPGINRAQSASGRHCCSGFGNGVITQITASSSR
jgi:hypothetical protein